MCDVCCVRISDDRVEGRSKGFVKYWVLLFRCNNFEDSFVIKVI